MTMNNENKLIPLDEERCREVEATFAEVAERREQVRLSRLWHEQMDRAVARAGRVRSGDTRTFRWR